MQGLLGHVQALELLEIPNYWAGITTCPEPSCRSRSCCCTCVVYGVTL